MLLEGTKNTTNEAVGHWVSRLAREVSSAFDTQVVLMFEKNENITIVYRLIIQACSCNGWCDLHADTGSKFILFISMHVRTILSSNNVKNTPRTFGMEVD